jgi:hypothetical protein
MGIFDSKQKTETMLEVPDWLKDAAPDVKDRMMNLLERESLTPEQRVAELDPAQQQGIDQMIGYGQEGGTGKDILNSIMGGIGGYEEGQGRLGELANMDTPQNQGVDMDYVGGLIDNDVLGGQIDAATRDVERRFSEVDAPASRMQQALSGGTGSTRGAIGDAILQRGAEDRTGDIAGSMRGNAFAQALGLGGQRAAQNPALELQGMSMQGNMASNLSSLGLEGAGMGQKIGIQNMGLMMQGGGMNRAYEQALNDIEYQNWKRAYGDVEMANNIFNDQATTYGTKKTTQTSTPSAFEIGTSLASTFMGMPSMGGGGAGGGSFSSAGDFIDEDQWDFGIYMDILPVC